MRTTSGSIGQVDDGTKVPISWIWGLTAALVAGALLVGGFLVRTEARLVRVETVLERVEKVLDAKASHP